MKKKNHPASTTQSRHADLQTAGSHPILDRRDFLSKAAYAILGAGGVGSMIAWTRFAVPNVPYGKPFRFALGKSDLFRVGTTTWIGDHDVFVRRDIHGFGVFSSKCTHLGCTIKKTADGFICPCHGARYDDRGGIIHGPTTKPLPWYHIWIESDGVLWIDKQTRVINRTSFPKIVV